MNLVAASVYWVIISIWLAVLATVGIAYMRKGRIFGASRLLLMVVLIDTFRNLVENVYFGLYFGAQYGFFPHAIVETLGQPHLLIVPKLINICAASIVLGLLVMRWLPLAQQERANAESEIRATSVALTQEVEEHHRLFETSVDLIVVIDRNRRITRISSSVTSLLGYQPKKLLGRYGGDFIAPGFLDLFRAELTNAARGGALRNFDADFLDRNGHLVTLTWSGVWSPQAQRFFLIGRDMSAQRAAEKQLRYLAHFDQLTDLPNRTSLDSELSAWLAENAESMPASVVLFDLDGFKEVNDTLGHSTGDHLLQEVAERLKGLAPKAASIYRHGGDEFVMFLRECGDPAVAAAAVNAILRTLERSFEIDGKQIYIGASAGIAIAPGHGTSVSELIANADLALYDAKATGGRCYRLFVPTLRAAAQARRSTETELRRAVSENEFVLFFQPQIRLSDGGLVGAEALLRWNHPERGILGPGVFIDALERSADALQIGRFVLQSACETVMSWQARGLPLVRVGVNLFPVQFRDEVLLHDVEATLAASGLPADRLELEITENIALNSSQDVVPSLRKLRQRGVGIAFDDFGTGYASLSCLTQYPLSRIKIDRSFIRNISNGAPAEQTAVAASIIVMGRSLGLDVIAEGVETAAQQDFLRAHGCGEAQGFLYAPPLSAAEFEAFLQENVSRRAASSRRVIGA